MKLFTPRFAVPLALFGGACLLSVAFAQSRGAAKTASARPMRVALVDLRQIFEGYHKRKELEAEVIEAGQAAQQKAQAMVEKLKAVQEQLQSGKLEQGSPEWIAQEEKAIQLSTSLKTLEQVAKRDLARKQADAMLVAYRDVEDALARFAEYNGYTLVLQMNREVADSNDPQEVNRQLGQNIIYRRDAEDITDPVLTWLNRQYDAEAASPKTGSSSAPAAAAKKGRTAR